LAEDVDGVTHQLDRQLLHETVRAFVLTNDDLAGGTGMSETAGDIQLACHSCQVEFLFIHATCVLTVPVLNSKYCFGKIPSRKLSMLLPAN